MKIEASEKTTTTAKWPYSFHTVEPEIFCELSWHILVTFCTILPLAPLMPVKQSPELQQSPEKLSPIIGMLMKHMKAYNPIRSRWNRR